jgi:hypothetical protein
VGLSYDNLLVKNGIAHRIDAGGSLLFRAQGGLKGSAFGNTVSELKTLRDFNMNSNSARVFENLSRDEIIEGLKKINKISDDDLLSTIKLYSAGTEQEKLALFEKMKARREFMNEEYPEARLQNKNPLFSKIEVWARLRAVENYLKKSDYLTIANVPKNNPKAELFFEYCPPEYPRAMWAHTTSHVYRDVNKILLRSKLEGAGIPKEVADYEELINDAILHAPPARLVNGLSTRSMNMTNEAAMEYLNRLLTKMDNLEPYSFETISSSTLGDTSAFGGNVIIEIQGKTGLNISPISQFENENEVLFGTNQKFKIVSAEEKNGRFFIQLKEI